MERGLEKERKNRELARDKRQRKECRCKRRRRRKKRRGQEE